MIFSIIKWILEHIEYVGTISNNFQSFISFRGAKWTDPEWQFSFDQRRRRKMGPSKPRARGLLIDVAESLLYDMP